MIVLQAITGWRPDEDGEWVAELSCGHARHVRHQPPLWPRPWVLASAGRAEQLGQPIDCGLCGQLVLPDGCSVVRSAGPFDEHTLPDGLRHEHRLAAGVWGRLRLLDGSLDFQFAGEGVRSLAAGEEQVIPPTVPHQVVLHGGVRLVIDFLRPMPAVREGS